MLNMVIFFRMLDSESLRLLEKKKKDHWRLNKWRELM